MIEPGARENVETAIREYGGHPLDFHVAAEGLSYRRTLEGQTARV